VGCIVFFYFRMLGQIDVLPFSRCSSGTSSGVVSLFWCSQCSFHSVRRLYAYYINSWVFLLY